MVERIKSQIKQLDFYSAFRFMCGMLILVPMLYYDLGLEREVEVWLYGFPAYLIGMDLTKLYRPK